jgi:hypothetical protein
VTVVARFCDRLEGKRVVFTEAQKRSSVATARLRDGRRVNLSAQGYDSFCAIFMFCAAKGAPNMMWLDGRGSVMQFNDQGFAVGIAKLPPGHGRARDAIFADIEKVQDSCGWSVPFMELNGERDQLRRYIDHLELDAWHGSRLAKNTYSIDGLPGLVRSKAAQ